MRTHRRVNKKTSLRWSSRRNWRITWKRVRRRNMGRTREERVAGGEMGGNLRVEADAEQGGAGGNQGRWSSKGNRGRIWRRTSGEKWHEEKQEEDQRRWSSRRKRKRRREGFTKRVCVPKPLPSVFSRTEMGEQLKEAGREGEREEAAVGERASVKSSEATERDGAAASTTR